MVRAPSYPLVSVVMACFNAEKYLREAIQSILSQTYSNLEFIIIDDGSTDNTLTILNEYLENDKRIKIFQNFKNKGLIFSLNRGIELALGEFIARMDADDISSNERIQAQFDFFMKHPEVSIVSCRNFIMNEKGKKLFKDNLFWETSKALRFIYFFNHPLGHGSVMLRTCVLKENKYDAHALYCEDYELWARLLTKNYLSAMIEPAQYYWRRNQKGITISNTSVQDKNYSKIAFSFFINYFDLKIPENLFLILLNRIEELPNIQDFKKVKTLIFSLINEYVIKENIKKTDKEYLEILDFADKQTIDVSIQLIKKSLQVKNFKLLFIIIIKFYWIFLHKNRINYLLKKSRDSFKLFLN